MKPRFLVPPDKDQIRSQLRRDELVALASELVYFWLIVASALLFIVALGLTFGGD